MTIGFAGLGGPGALQERRAPTPVPEKCGRFSDKDRLEIKEIEHFR